MLRKTCALITVSALLFQTLAWQSVAYAAPAATPEQNLLEEIIRLDGRKLSRGESASAVESVLAQYAQAYRGRPAELASAFGNLQAALRALHLETPALAASGEGVRPLVQAYASELREALDRGATQAEIDSIAQRLTTQVARIAGDLSPARGAEFNACKTATIAAKVFLVGVIVGLVATVAIGGFPSDVPSNSWPVVLFGTSFALTGLSGITAYFVCK